MPTRERDHGQGEQFARAGARHAPQHPGKQLRPTTSMKRDEGATLPQRDAPASATASAAVRHRRPPAAERARPAPAAAPAPAPSTRSSTTSQPTAMRPSTESSAPRCSSARSSTTVLATDSARPNTQAGAQASSPTATRRAAPSRGRDHDLQRVRPAARSPCTASRSRSEKCSADAEHQQHDADLGQLRGEVRVGHEPRGMRADGDAGDQIADDGRQTQPHRQ